jgi:hypothetical protein
MKNFKVDSEGPRHIHECEDCSPLPFDKILSEPTPPAWTTEKIYGLLESGDSDAINCFVRIVNAHEKLLEACKYLLLCHKNDTTINRDHLPPPNPDAIKLAEQAIAMASTAKEIR